LSSPPAPASTGPALVRDRLIAAVGLAATIAVLLAHRDAPLRAPWLAAVLLVSTWLSVIDARQHRLPNRIVGPLAAGVSVVVLAAAWADGDLGRAGRALGIGLATAAVLLVVNLVGGLGMGDVKYGYPFGATLAWFGLDALMVAVLVTTAAGGLVAAALLARGRGRDHRVSYGPFMALGLAAGLMTAGG
jgi:leader peptidase (prepilin peptidase)/N-methyltransferase